MMALLEDDENLEDELLLLDDFNVIPRPQELIDLETRSSASKSASWSKIAAADRSGGPVSKRSSDKKTSSNKEKRVSKHERKGSSKTKLPFKKPLSEGSSTRKFNTDELDNKFESFVQKAKNSIAKRKTESKTSRNDDTSDQDSNKRLGSQFLKIVAEPAVTPLQKFQVLDARDSLLRAKTSKLGDSKKGKITGTCPDMCPEKERYGRIGKNCLSVLEMKTAFDPNAMSRDADHSCMVKEYSRSSADQQEPLPHELRPISMLMFTMDYLIHNIMDMPLENITLADWYDFIWNRTRSIRKDITQQELGDTQSVEIIEKCVRFHIHCAEALSEEDTATFDPRINNENLNKCLQTLKHMYHDLQSKGIQSPNEAEFRSYDILLSLTDGETLRLIKDIRKDLLKSPLIKSAFEAALAFKSHNYVKFFKIIERANYLSSCILHRYIIEARIRAIQIIVRAYSTLQNVSLYPTCNLVKDLKFESVNEACDFCRCHGLEADENCITIDRKNFSRSASGLPASRSYLLVGSKRGRSLGKIINNGELPINPLLSYQPHNSFDEKNMLKTIDLGPITKENENVVNIDLTVDEQMETDEATVFTQAESSNTSTVVPVAFLKDSEKLKIRNASIQELEKHRSSLLEKLSKLKYLNADKMKQKKSELAKSPQKVKESKTSKVASAVQLPVRLSSENVESSKQDFNNFKPLDNSKPNIFSEKLKLSLSDYFTSNETTKQTDSPFSQQTNFGFLKPSSSPLQFSDYLQDDISSKSKSAVSNTAKHYKSVSSSSNINFDSSKVTVDLKSDSAVSNLLLHLKSASDTPHVNTGSSEFLKNFSFKTTSVPEISLSGGFASKIDIPVIDSTEGHSFPCEQATFDGDVFQQTESLSPGKKSSVEAEEETDFAEIEIPDKEVEVQEIIPDDFDEVLSRSSSVEKELKITEEERQEEEFEKFVQLVADDIYSKCLEECSISICEEVLNEEKNLKAQLEDELEMMQTNLALKVILKWKLFCQRKIQRRAFENSKFYSTWQPMLLNTPYMKSGAMSPYVVYNKNCSLNKLAEKKIKERKKITPGWEEFKAEEVWPLSIFKPYPSAYLGCRIKYFCKLCLVFPADYDTPDLEVLKNWICAKFSLQKSENFRFDCTNSFTLHGGKALISVRAIQLGSETSFQYAKILDGITAMILFIPDSLEVIHSFCEDFTSLLDSDTLQYPYPLFAYFMKSQEVSERVMSFLEEKLDSFYFTGLKAECLPEINQFSKNSIKVMKAVKWLLQLENKSFSPPWLHECHFQHYVEDAFTYAFNILFCKISLDEFKCLKKMPQHIINFYNKVLKFRASALCSDLLERIRASWPPEEVKKHLNNKFLDMQIQSKCREKMKCLLLPDFEGEPMSISHVWKYVKSVSTLLASKDKDMLFIRIQNVLQNASSFDWLNLISMCALYLIQAQCSEMPLSSVDLSVFYTRDDLEMFDCEEFWSEVISSIRSHTSLSSIKRKNDSLREIKSKKMKWDFVDKEKFSPIKDYHVKEKNVILNPFDMPDILSCQRDSFFAPLKAAVAKQMEQSEAFIHKLNESVMIGNISSVNINEENLSEEIKVLDEEISVTAIDSSNMVSYETVMNSKNKSDLLDISVNISNKNSLSSIADKISELKYKMEKNSILEDHLSQLLCKQL